MKILYVCHRLPYPPTRGGKIRPFNTIRYLSRTHEVTVASLAHTAEEARDGADLAEHCHAVIAERTFVATRVARAVACLPTTRPSTMGYFHSSRLARRIRAATASGGFDLIMVHSSSMAPYVLHDARTPKIVDFGDMDSQKWLAYARYQPLPASGVYWIEGHKLQRAEARLAAAFDVCTCTTRAEVETLVELAAPKHFDWFPNGVDADYFHPAASYDPDTICFVGRMDYYPNQQAMLAFCGDTLPLIRATRPATQLRIIGAEPTRAIRHLGTIPGVTVTGTVPDVRPHLEAAALSVAPLHIARGTQNKILESMAMAVPVVCSEIAARGVDAIPGEHLLTADRPRDCADAILRLLDDRSARDRLAQAGRARVLSHHSWAASMRKLDGIIDRCMTSAGRGGAGNVVADGRMR